MCGVPVHAADDYLQKLIAKGYRVAVCEQTEDPAEAQETRLESRWSGVRSCAAGNARHADRRKAAAPRPQSNYLMTLAARVKGMAQGGMALAWVDISTGTFRLAETSAESRLVADVMRLDPQGADRRRQRVS